jgi:serine protease Do
MPERAEKKANVAPRWIHGLVKLVACSVGLPLAVLGAASVIGLLTGNPWIRFGGALALVGIVPLVIADRLLPSGDQGKAQGLVTDVMAFVWMGLATTTVALGTTTLRAPLHTEAERCDDSGWTRVAGLARWMAPDDEPEEISETVVASLEPPLDATGAAPTEVVQGPTPDGADAPAESAEAGEAVQTDAEVSPSRPREPLDPASLFEAWAPSVVTVKAKTPFGFGGTGTGFIVSRDGIVATNHHVIDGGATLELALFDGTVIDDIDVLVSDAAIDLALLKVKTEEPLAPVVLGDSAAVKVGEPVIVIGNPLGLEHTLSDGLLSARRLYAGKRYIQMTAPVSPGNSGGPVFNRYGEVIGVTVAKIGFGAGENLNLAIPVDQLTPLLESPNKKGRSRW